MLSPKQAAQPNPSYPALRRQHTTSSMEHRLRRKQLNSDTDASKKNIFERKTRKKKRRNFFSKNQKMKTKKRKNEKLKARKKTKKREKKKVGKKGKEGPKIVFT